MRLSTSKHTPSGRLHRHSERYNPRPVAPALACELTCRYQGAAVDALIQCLAGSQNTAVAPENLFRSLNLFVSSLVSDWTNIPAYINNCKYFCPLFRG